MGCTMVQFVWQEFDKLAKFANSLLSRSSKLTDLAQSLENEMHHVKGKDPESPDVARSEKLGAQRELISNSQRKRYKSKKWISSSTLIPFSYVSLLRAIKGLDDAIAVLEKQFEAVEETKANVLDLKEGSPDDNVKAEFFGSF